MIELEEDNFAGAGLVEWGCRPFKDMYEDISLEDDSVIDLLSRESSFLPDTGLVFWSVVLELEDNFNGAGPVEWEWDSEPFGDMYEEQEDISWEEVIWDIQIC